MHENLNQRAASMAPCSLHLICHVCREHTNPRALRPLMIAALADTLQELQKRCQASAHQPRSGIGCHHRGPQSLLCLEIGRRCPRCSQQWPTGLLEVLISQMTEPVLIGPPCQPRLTSSGVVSPAKSRFACNIHENHGLKAPDETTSCS